MLFHSADVNRKLYLVLFDFVSLSARSGRFRSLLEAFFESCRRRDVGIIEDGIEHGHFRRVSPEDAAVTIRAGQLVPSGGGLRMRHLVDG